jgi:uncharacterized protein YbgA (DUF1722 family)
LEGFRAEGELLDAPLALLHSWALPLGEDYLEAQALFAPYTLALMDLKTS